MYTNARPSIFLRITIYYAAVFVAILLITKLAPQWLNYLPFGGLASLARNTSGGFVKSLAEDTPKSPWKVKRKLQVDESGNSDL